MPILSVLMKIFNYIPYMHFLFFQECEEIIKLCNSHNIERRLTLSKEDIVLFVVQKSYYLSLCCRAGTLHHDNY